MLSNDKNTCINNNAILIIITNSTNTNEYYLSFSLIAFHIMLRPSAPLFLSVCVCQIEREGDREGGH